jgi:hypothetical protein
MSEKLLCGHANSTNICARLFILGYDVYQDDISDVSNFGIGDLDCNVAGGHYV